jgi:hypothetical protein
MQKGDKVCLILGTNVPYILRKVEDNYKPIGEVYCHSLMNGEGMHDLKEIRSRGEAQREEEAERTECDPQRIIMLSII